jgi:hypothetical protein
MSNNGFDSRTVSVLCSWSKTWHVKTHDHGTSSDHAPNQLSVVFSFFLRTCKRTYDVRTGMTLTVWPNHRKCIIGAVPSQIPVLTHHVSAVREKKSTIIPVLADHTIHHLAVGGGGDRSCNTCKNGRSNWAIQTLDGESGIHGIIC